jgi:dehydrogenase/reductase SDR family protein 1
MHSREKKTKANKKKIMSDTKIRSLTGKIALVTGASRGVGKGVALQLGEAGATVYITGRTGKPTGTSLGSLAETCEEIKRRGGKCIPVTVDHENDQQVCDLFQQISREQNNRLDILVNCAYKAGSEVLSTSGMSFWEMRPEVWDEINNVGLRNNYICCVYAARLMVPAKQGLIINISSIGGIRYLFNVPYGVGKAALDRMSVDCGIDLRNSNVACLSLYPGVVKTELVLDTVNNPLNQGLKIKKGCNSLMKMADLYRNGESPEFTGKVVVALAQDPKVMSYTSSVVVAADYAQMHKIRDIDNRQIASYRQLAFLAQLYLPARWQYLTQFIPGFFKIPNFLINTATSKF